MKKKFLILFLGLLMIALLSAFSPLQNVDPGEVTAESLALVAGGVVSLVFSYFPVLKVKFSKLKPDYQRLIMVAALLLTAGGIYGLSCAEIYSQVACTSAGAWHMIELFFISLIANQGTWLISPKFKKLE